MPALPTRRYRSTSSGVATELELMSAFLRQIKRLPARCKASRLYNACF